MVAFEPNLCRIVYMRIFEAASTFTALTFVKRVKAMYESRMEVLTDGAQYYRTACKFLNLGHYAYDLKARNFMESIVQYIEDRMKDFDDYMPYRREGCDRKARSSAFELYRINEVCLNKDFDLEEFLEKTLSAIEASRMLKFTEPLRRTWQLKAY